MRKNDLVSIIIPIYNVEEYLHECLDSIVGQTYKELEIILINDGSSDSSGKIADEYASKDKRIKVVHKQNEGQPATKNLGIKMATGKYITFVDSDDYIRKDYIENLVNSMINNNVLITTTTKTHPIDTFNKEDIIVYKQNEAFKLLFYGTLENSENGVQMFDRKLLLDNNVRSNPDKRIGEDFDFLVQALMHSDRIAVDNRKMYYYRPNPTSMMNQQINTEIMKSIETFSSAGKDVINMYPNLEPAVNAKRFNDSVALAVRAYEVRSEWQIDYKNLLQNISRLKLNVLLDSNVRKKVRVAALIYCVFGNNIGTFIIKGIKR